jgi:formate hydrogenlyase subunit 3/multisubunit Na+/H+ antiporter MnhD subunit
MEEMGGLIRRMPVTAACFLVGAVAISGLPPLNGFVSEWLTYQALLAGFGSTASLTRMVFPIAGALLALTAALAAACFVKAFGISFLALPRLEFCTFWLECLSRQNEFRAGIHIEFNLFDAVLEPRASFYGLPRAVEQLHLAEIL